MEYFRKYIILAAVVTILVGLNSCKDNSAGPLGGEVKIVREKVTVNPSGVAPLTASIDVETNKPVRVSVRVVGQNGSESDIRHKFGEFSEDLEIPVLGLYANHTNTVELIFYDRSDQKLGTKAYQVETASLMSELPEIEIEQAQRDQMTEGLTFVGYFGHTSNSEVSPQRPFMFDSFGDIRWYLDYQAHNTLSDLFYDDGPERLQNGNLYFGDGATDAVYEVNMLGEIINRWEMPGYGFHHEVSEKPNGNFLVTVNKDGLSTIEDHIIEIDRNSGSIVNVWDLNKSLDNSRRAWDTSIGDISEDWFHANAVEFDASDNTIIVSGRHQGTVKLTENNEVVWILAPHKGWETSGYGTDLSQYLLQPLDADGQPITDSAVLAGDENHPDFEWAWYQHAPQVMPNGNIMLFDNGDNRNYTGSRLYSRVVEYEIDIDQMTIKQVWSYGKGRGGETFARIVSDVDYYPQEQRVFFSPGAVSFNGRKYGKAIEMSYDQQQIIFEATILPPAAAYGIITLHRTERMQLYPE